MSASLRCVRRLLVVWPVFACSAGLLTGCAASGRADFDLARRVRFDGAATEVAWAPGDDWRGPSPEAWALGAGHAGAVALAEER